MYGGCILCPLYPLLKLVITIETLRYERDCFSHCLINLFRSLFDFNSMKEIFSVNSERANGKKNAVVKQNSTSWAESKEAGPKVGPEAGQDGKLVSVEWLTKSSPGQVSRHLFITGVTMFRRTNAKGKRKKTSFEYVHDLSWRSPGEKRDNLHLPSLGMIRCTKISTVSRCLRSR